MMTVQERISQWVDAHEAELIRDIGRLVAVRSVRGEAEPDAPFGPGPRAALDEALALCSEYGFATEIYGCAVGTADLNDQPSRLDILGHLDVVVEGDGWDTPPYEAVLKGDGCLYGRGTDDDKGPVVMALFAMRCVRELGLPIKHGCRLIMGTNEESGSEDLPHYYSKHAPAPNTFTPDTGFPVYNVEKGTFRPHLTRSWLAETALPRVSSIEGGLCINVIPADARATVLGMDAAEVLRLGADAAARCGVVLSACGVDSGAELSVHGRQAHASTPWEGANGITALLAVLSSLPLADCESTRAIRTLAECFPHGDWLGETCGIAQKDDISGELTISLDLLSLCDTGLDVQLDSRVPICADEANCKQIFDARLSSLGFSVESEMHPAHHTPAEGEFVSTLLRCYETYSGRKGECVATGGGTYVHEIPGGVAFGAGMPGFVSNMHGANERINIRDSLAACKIFALAIAELCGE